MKRKIFLFLTPLLLVSLAVLGYLIFRPRHYDVSHLQIRNGIQYWDLNTGSRIGYILIPARGNKQPFPLIYLHGGPGAGITDREVQTFTTFADEGYDVYLYDQVGCGHSNRLDNIDDYTANRHLTDLEEIIKKINSGKVILAGQSWGSILAVMFLAENPEKVEKLIITAPAAIQPEKKELRQIKAPDNLNLRLPVVSNKWANIKTSNLRSKMMMYLSRNYGIKLVGDKEADEYATFLTNELNKSMVCDTLHAVKAEGTEGMYVHLMTFKSLSAIKDPRPKIRNIHVPVLLMKAQCDNQLWGYTTEYMDLFPNLELVVVPDAGHNIFLEKPDVYTGTIVNFLKK